MQEKKQPDDSLETFLNDGQTKSTKEYVRALVFLGLERLLEPGEEWRLVSASEVLDNLLLGEHDDYLCRVTENGSRHHEELVLHFMANLPAAGSVAPGSSLNAKNIDLWYRDGKWVPIDGYHRLLAVWNLVQRGELPDIPSLRAKVKVVRDDVDVSSLNRRLLVPVNCLVNVMSRTFRPLMLPAFLKVFEYEYASWIVEKRVVPRSHDLIPVLNQLSDAFRLNATYHKFVLSALERIWGFRLPQRTGGAKVVWGGRPMDLEDLLAQVSAVPRGVGSDDSSFEKVHLASQPQGSEDRRSVQAASAGLDSGTHAIKRFGDFLSLEADPPNLYPDVESLNALYDWVASAAQTPADTDTRARGLSSHVPHINIYDSQTAFTEHLSKVRAAGWPVSSSSGLGMVVWQLATTVEIPRFDGSFQDLPQRLEVLIRWDEVIRANPCPQCKSSFYVEVEPLSQHERVLFCTHRRHRGTFYYKPYNEPKQPGDETGEADDE